MLNKLLTTGALLLFSIFSTYAVAQVDTVGPEIEEVELTAPEDMEKAERKRYIAKEATRICAEETSGMKSDKKKEIKQVFRECKKREKQRIRSEIRSKLKS